MNDLAQGEVIFVLILETHGLRYVLRLLGGGIYLASNHGYRGLEVLSCQSGMSCGSCGSAHSAGDLVKTSQTVVPSGGARDLRDCLLRGRVLTC